LVSGYPNSTFRKQPFPRKISPPNFCYRSQPDLAESHHVFAPF
jgi:hypothetical protein